MRAIPVDPITDRADTWLITTPPDYSQRVYDLHSGSNEIASDGTPLQRLVNIAIASKQVSPICWSWGLYSLCCLASPSPLKISPPPYNAKREADLLFVGQQYRNAIASYYHKSPNGIKQLPLKLEDLLEDKRSLTVQHHLRKLYRDPMTESDEWGLLRDGTGPDNWRL